MTAQEALWSEPERCSIDGCRRPLHLRGWCNAHYIRWRRHGDPTAGGKMEVRGTPEERFWIKTDKRGRDECWPWLGGLTASGYGVFTIGRRNIPPHRFAYELFFGPVAAHLVMDHLCHTVDADCVGGDRCPHRACVNPHHLEPVTNGENGRRGHHAKARQKWSASITHCKHGHEYTPENTFVRRDGGRQCRICMRRWTRGTYYRKKGNAANG